MTHFRRFVTYSRCVWGKQAWPHLTPEQAYAELPKVLMMQFWIKASVFFSY